MWQIICSHNLQATHSRKSMNLLIVTLLHFLVVDVSDAYNFQAGKFLNPSSVNILYGSQCQYFIQFMYYNFFYDKHDTFFSVSSNSLPHHEVFCYLDWVA